MLRFTLPAQYSAVYYQQLDRIYALTSWLGITFIMGLPFLVPLAYPQLLLFYSLIGFEAAVLAWCYGTMRHTQVEYKYYVTEIVGVFVALMLMILIGRSGLFFFFSILVMQIISAVLLFRYRHIFMVFGGVIVSITYLFFLHDVFLLGDDLRFGAGVTLLFAFTLMSLYLMFAVQQVVLIILEVEEVKYEFIQDASHELRTPLTVIKGVLGLIQDRRLVMPVDEPWADTTLTPQDMLRHFRSATNDLE